MKVDVKLYATLRSFAPKNLEIGEAFQLELNDGTVREALERLQIPSDKAKIILVNGIRILDMSDKLSEKDLLVIFPPIGGG